MHHSVEEPMKALKVSAAAGLISWPLAPPSRKMLNVPVSLSYHLSPTISGSQGFKDLSPVVSEIFFCV